MYSNLLVECLLKNNANPNLQSDLGFTALMSSCMYSNNYSNNETIKLLLNYGADVNMKNIYKQTALIICTEFQKNNINMETVELLLKIMLILIYKTRMV